MPELGSMSNAKICRVALEVEAEVLRAMSLYAGMNSAHEAYAVILEELDEFWDLAKLNPRKLSDQAQADRLRAMREELVQVAAMCVRAIVDCELA
jgi:hypothetical protein